MSLAARPCVDRSSHSLALSFVKNEKPGSFRLRAVNEFFFFTAITVSNRGGNPTQT
jgi:hypothetical protein